MKRLGGTLLVVALATMGMAAVIASPAAAITSVCDSGTAPAVPGAQSNLKIQCAIDQSDSSSRQVIHDYPFAQYHFGAARTVTVRYSATTGVFTLNGTATATNTFLVGGAGDLNRTVTTAAGTNQTCLKLKPKSYLKTVASTTSATVSDKTGSRSTQAQSTKNVSYVATSAMLIAAGSSTFTSCDVGRVISGGGFAANVSVKTFINSKLVIMSGNATATATNVVRTFGAETRQIKVNNTPARNLEGTATLPLKLTSGSTTVTGTASQVGTVQTAVTSTTATTIKVNQTVATPVPFTILIDNEQLNVTAVAGAANPRTYTVARGANGTTKATHAVSSPVRIEKVAGFNAATDVGMALTGTCVQPFTTIASVTNSMTAELSSPATCTTSAKSLTVDVSGGVATATSGTFDDADQFRIISTTGGCALTGLVRIASVTSNTVAQLTGTIADGSGCTMTLLAYTPLMKVTINGTKNSTAQASTARYIRSTTCSSNRIVLPAQTGSWQASDVNLVVKRGATSYRITSIFSATAASVTPSCTAAAATDATVGVATDTAPVTGDFVAQLATNIVLRPDLVDGSAPCNDNQFAGTTIAAQWRNVGSYVATTTPFGGQLVDYPRVSIAQLRFPTSVVTFQGFIAPRPAGFVDEKGDTDPQTEAHTDIVLPNLPTTLAICPGTNVSTGYTLIGQALGAQQLATGLGIPSSAIVRATWPLVSGDSGSYGGTAYVSLGGPGAGVITGDACTVDDNTDLAGANRGFDCLAP